jgi:hypothetical protein
MSNKSIMRDLLVACVAGAAAAATTTVLSRRAAPGGTKPLSQCEQDCIKNNPDDVQARLNCMLKCIADGKISFASVLAP